MGLWDSYCPIVPWSYSPTVPHIPRCMLVNSYLPLALIAGGRGPPASGCVIVRPYVNLSFHRVT